MNLSTLHLSAIVALQAAGTLITSAAQLITGSAAVPSSISAGGSSFGPVISDDGRRVAFVSHAGNLVTNETRGESLQVFVRDLVSSNIILVSVSANGRSGSGNSIAPMLSSNGQWAVFASEADDLVSGDTNGASDVFVRDLSSGITRLVSADLSGSSPIDDKINSIIPLSGNPLISFDGQWVFFESRATNLTAVADTNGTTDVFARNLQTNLTFVVSLDATGTRTAGGTSTLANISADGRYVAFISTAIDIDPGGTNQAGDIYVRDMVSGGRQCASANVGLLVPGSYRCIGATLSTNARYVAFATIGTSNAVFLHDFGSAGTTLISLRAAGAEGIPQISADGRYVMFDDGTNVFRFDRTTGTNELVSVATNGGQSVSGIARGPVITPDGNVIAFISNSPDLITNGSARFQIYVREMANGITRLITVATNGQPSTTNNEASLIAVARDFSRVVFDSTAADLVAGDGNRTSDVFVHDVATQTTSLVTRRDPSRARVSGVAHSLVNRDCISADARFIAFGSYDNDLMPGDANGWPDIFVLDSLTGTIVAPDFSTNVAKLPAISANGRYVAYARFRGGSGFSTYAVGLFRFDCQTGIDEFVSPLSSLSVGQTPLPPPVISSDGNLIVFETNSVTQILMRNMAAGTNYLVSVNRFENGGGNGASGRPLLSADSRWVIFESQATDLTTNNVLGLFARDIQSNSTYLLSVGPTWGAYINASATLSGNSRYVAFSSWDRYLTVHDLLTHTSVVADNPVARSPALNHDGRYIAYVKQPSGVNFDQIYVRDLQSAQINLVSVNVSGSPGNGPSSNPLLSGDGRFVVFESRASDLVPNDTNGANDIFARDRVLGVTVLVSANAQGLPGNGPSSLPVMAADGRTVVFQSFANDLATGDYNDKRDVFVLKLSGADTDGDGMDDDWEVAYFGNLSRDGTEDFDGDGAMDLAEFLAGTDPTAFGSVFRVLTVTPAGGGATQLIWSGNPNRTYRAEFKDDLGANWTAVNATISWNGSTASITDTTATNSAHRYYRAVRLP